MNAFRTGCCFITGMSHRMQGRESQDSAVCEQRQKFQLLLVSDGAGSARESKIGSLVITQLVRSLVMEAQDYLVPLSTKKPAAEFGTALVKWLDHKLRQELLPVKEALRSYTEDDSPLAATLLGCFMTSSVTVLFGCGDGCVCVNDEALMASSGHKNQPDLLAYSLDSGPLLRSGKVFGQLRPIFCGPTAEVNSVMLGTDGVEELLPGLPRGLEQFGGSAISWVDEFIQRMLDISASGHVPYDDVTAVGAWRR